MIAFLTNLVCLLLAALFVFITIRRGVLVTISAGRAALALFFLFRTKHLDDPPLDR